MSNPYVTINPDGCGFPYTPDINLIRHIEPRLRVFHAVEWANPEGERFIGIEISRGLLFRVSTHGEVEFGDGITAENVWSVLAAEVERLKDAGHLT